RGARPATRRARRGGRELFRRRPPCVQPWASDDQPRNHIVMMPWLPGGAPCSTNHTRSSVGRTAAVAARHRLRWLCVCLGAVRLSWPEFDVRCGAEHSWLVTVVLIAFGCLLASWAVLILLAARLPPGIMKELVRFLPACVTMIRRLRRDPRAPRSAKIAVLLAMVWVISPIDLIPEFLPVVGPLDDVVVVALALRYAARRVPRLGRLEAWRGDLRLLERLRAPSPEKPPGQ